MIPLDLDDLAYGVGLSSRQKVSRPLQRLERFGFIRRAREGLTTWVLLCDPVQAVPRLYEQGLLNETDVERINDVLVANERIPVDLAALLARSPMPPMIEASDDLASGASGKRPVPPETARRTKTRKPRTGAARSSS